LNAHGDVFAEVKANPDLGQIRVTRPVGAFTANRIVNPHRFRETNRLCLIPISEYMGQGVGEIVSPARQIGRKAARLAQGGLAPGPTASDELQVVRIHCPNSRKNAVQPAI
jgi:hypothetical protein